MDNIKDKNFVHQSAIVDKGAKIGEETKVWHFSHIMSKAIIGKNCILGQNVFVANNVTLGDNCKIQNNVSLYEGVHLEEDVFVGPSVVFTNVINPRSFIERKTEYKATIVGKGSSIGANATILCGVKIGKYAMIGAGALVVKDVQDYQVIKGNYAQEISWISKAGIKLDFVKDDKSFCKRDQVWYKLENNKVSIIENE